MISMERMRVVECNQAYLTNEAFRLRFRLNFPTSRVGWRPCGWEAAPTRHSLLNSFSD
jgi:hypothetical protein